MINPLWQDFLERLDNILVYRKGEQRAPHKPLYILFCIASMQKRRPRLQKFYEINDALAEALRLFGLRTKSFHPEYPFWRLQNDGLSIVETDGPLKLRKSNDDPTRSSLLRTNARGGFLEEDFALLNGDLNLQSMAVHKLLDAHFPVSIHDDILRHFNLVLNEPHSKDRASEAEFRTAVLSAYGNACALSGFSLSFIGQYVGLEAAHICWPQAGGNDDVSNGIAMNTLYRKLFHLGLFAINQKYEIVVSKEINDASKSDTFLKKYQGKQIVIPSESIKCPNKDSLKWHMKWVFRG